jgi:predicted SAM-dependent methyltransferase
MQLKGALPRRVRRFRHRGDAVQCPCCDRTYGSFAPAWNRDNAICPGCGSHERHRLTWLYLRDVEQLGSARPMQVLHFAPEYALRERLASLPGVDYTTCDLDPAGVDVQVDITAMPFADESFDAIVCSHVLEHVPADAQAMAELYRVVRAGGWVMVMVPLDQTRERTYEDPALTSEADRLRAFGQEDHVRQYAPDIADRLRGAGFEVTPRAYADELGEEARRRYGLLSSDVVFRCARLPS